MPHQDTITQNNLPTPEDVAKKSDMTNIVKVEGVHDFPETTKGE